MSHPPKAAILALLLAGACTAGEDIPQDMPSARSDLTTTDQATPADLSSDQATPDLLCALPRSICTGVCVDIQVDNAHCGGCNRPCSGVPDLQFTCCGGACVGLKQDPNNCGVCGRKCAATLDCIKGVCQ